MSESISDDSDFIDMKKPSKQSIFRKYLIVSKKQIKYFFERFPHWSKDKKRREGFLLFVAISSYILYYLSLGGCDGTQTECLKNSNIAYYYLLVSYCFVSAGCVSLILFLILCDLASKLHLIHLIIIFFILFISDTGSTLMHHGIYNIIGFTIFMTFYCLFLLTIFKIQDILTKKSLPIKLVAINIIIIIVIFGRYSFHEALKKECKDWDLGLNNTRIEDDINKYPCQIFRPISCHINYFNNKQDLSNLLKLDCSNGVNSNQAINSRNQLIKYINKKDFENTKNFGFPLTNTPKFIIDQDTTPDSFTKKVYDNIIDMDNKNKPIVPEEYPEVILSFEETKHKYKKGDNSTKYMGKININITRNETLSSSRKKLENNESLFNNIIMIYTDAVSRAHFKRKMPKTCAFIEKLMKNNYENDYIKYMDEFNQKNFMNNNTQNIEQNIEKENKLSHLTKKRLLDDIIESEISQQEELNNNNKTINNPANKANLKKQKQNMSLNNFDLIKNKTIKNSTKIRIRKEKLPNKSSKNNKTTLLSNLRKKMKLMKNFKKQYNLTDKQIFEKLKIRKIKAIKEHPRSPRKLETINNTSNYQNISNIGNNIENKYYAYQFLKYHTFTSGTKFNAMPMFYGTSVFSVKGTNIIKYFKELGYITAQTTDMCSKEVWEPEKEPHHLDFETWDHENIAMFCDPSYMDRKSLYSIYKGVYSLLRRCFYGKEVHDYIIEYGTKFWEAYPDNKKFLRMGFNDGHESTFEVLKYLDEPLAEFFEEFSRKGYLKNTAIIIISDHGNHMPGLYNLFLSEQFETERVLGNLFLIINTDKIDKFRNFNKNVMINQQSIITPYDIHNTLIHIITGNKDRNTINDRGTSIFMEINNSERNCNFFDQDTEEKGLCRCIPNNKYEKFIYYDNKK